MVIPLGSRLVTRATGLLLAPCVKEPTHLKPEWKVKNPRGTSRLLKKQSLGVEVDGKNSHPALCPFCPTRGLGQL